MIHRNHRLSPEQMEDLTELQQRCLIEDKSLPSFYPNLLITPRDFPNLLYYQEEQLIGFLSAYNFYTRKSEVTLLIDPAWRRQKKASALLQILLNYLTSYSIEQLIFSCPPRINKEALQKWGLVYETSEYRLRNTAITSYLSETTHRDLIIRKATTEDIKALCFLDATGFNVQQDAQMYQHFTSLVGNPNYTVLLGLKNQHIVGKIHMRWDKTAAYISDIVVLPDYRRQKIASTLLAEALKCTSLKNLPTAFLDVEASNEHALKLYQRNGFATEHTVEYWTIEVESLKKMLA